MKIIMAPSKTQTSDVTMVNPCQVIPFPQQTAKIMTSLQRCSKQRLAKILKIDGHLLEETYGTLQSWVASGTTCGYHLYQGVAFDALHTLDQMSEAFMYMLSHVRVLSAVYGMIPLNTAVAPYRLDFMNRLWAKPTLITYWKKTIHHALAQEDWILDAASQEYSAILKGLKQPIIRVEFFSLIHGDYKVVSYTAKKMRGELIAWACRTQLSSPEQLASFTADGWVYDPSRSSSTIYSFIEVGTK